MTAPIPAAPDPSMPSHLSAEVMAAFEEAHQLQRDGKVAAAIDLLDEVLAKQTDLMQFKERVSLSLAIAEFLVAAGDSKKAIERLAVDFRREKENFQLIKISGSDEDKRLAFRGSVQLRDLHTRLRLIGEPAPELAVREWLNSPARSIAGSREEVLILEFWATWCKPCEQMFPRVKALLGDHPSKGLTVLALTRFFMAYGGTDEAKAQEMKLISDFVQKNEVTFPVGVSDDESMQTAYGATALPMLVLIDQRGSVRAFAFSPDDESFKQILEDCLSESI